MSLNLMRTQLPPSVIGARIALAPSTPPGGVPSGAPIGIRAGARLLPSPPPPPSLNRIVPLAIRANVATEATAPSAPTNQNTPTTGQMGSADNAGQVAGADSQVTPVTPGFAANIGGIGPLVVLGLAIFGVVALFKGE